MPTAHLNTHWAALLVEELVRCGVRRFFVAPGSRSTPLVVAVARHERAQSTLHYDERAAAFAALGYGRATGRPAGWITTSGTAVANGLPAAVEASTDGVPMLLLTADRPPEKRDTGANQTIGQPGIFGEYTRWAVDLPAPTDEIAPEMVLTTADQAVHCARRTPPGPVHVNCMFRKPLAPPEDDETGTKASPDAPARWRESDRPYTRRPVAAPTAPPDRLDALADALAGIRRGLVVCGRLDSGADARAALRLTEALDWPLVPDATARLRLAAEGSTAGPAAPYADLVLASGAFREACAPEAVIHLGGRTVSKRLRLFLKKHRPAPCVVARPDARRLDPDHRVSDHVETDVAPFCNALIERLDAPAEREADDWGRSWKRANAAVARVLDDFAAGADGLSEPLVARLVSRHRPPGGAFVLGSSMPVRDFNRYARPDANTGDAPRTPVFANRGASGIDGTVATAAGVCTGRCEIAPEGDQQRPVTLLLGDLAVLHDLGALALLRERPVTVVALNNGGGGIFHFLPIAEREEVFEPHFTTPHERSFEQAAAMFDLPYERPTTPEAFAAAYRERSRSGAPALIEVRTDRRENRALHERLESRVAEAVREALGA